jgi:ribosomal protein L37AE/L43A
MSRIATLIYQCPKCRGFFGSPGACPVCGTGLETKAAINVYELQQLIAKMATPEGLTNLLESFKEWVER